MATHFEILSRIVTSELRRIGIDPELFNVEIRKDFFGDLSISISLNINMPHEHVKTVEFVNHFIEKISVIKESIENSDLVLDIQDDYYSRGKRAVYESIVRRLNDEIGYISEEGE